MEAHMPANLEYRFTYIAPNTGANVFIHGYAENAAVVYSARVYAGSGPGVPNPVGHATISQGETFRHVDGTVARKVYVQNQAPFNSCTLDVLKIIETF
jgi:hypothetical protein